MDVAMPMVIAPPTFRHDRLRDRGRTRQEAAYAAGMEAIRPGRTRMGMGDVRNRGPKLGLLSPPRHGGAISARYFMPWDCHPAMAVTGSQCIASCVLTPGTVADGMRAGDSQGTPGVHGDRGGIRPARRDGDRRLPERSRRFQLRSAGLVRTARLLARGELFIPGGIWKT